MAKPPNFKFDSLSLHAGQRPDPTTGARATPIYQSASFVFPDTDYATDSRFKLDLIEDQLAAKEMSIARYYMQTEKWIPALNRLKLVVDKYDRTVFIEEALHRLVEVYYKIGLVDEAKKAASILGYNYASSAWYEQSYKVFNKKYRPIKLRDEKKELGLVRRTIKKLF